MIKITVASVQEAVVIADALALMIKQLNDNKNQYDRKLFEDTVKYLNRLRIKYYKISLTQVFRNSEGNFQLLIGN